MRWSTGARRSSPARRSISVSPTRRWASRTGPSRPTSRRWRSIPSDADSKVNLELLLRSNEERKQKQQMGKPQEDKQKQEGKDQQKQQSQGGEQKPDPRKQAGDQQQENEKQPSQEKPGEEQAPRPDEKKQAQAGEKPVDRSEAERLLDALRADEKNLQPWRFAREKTKERQRRDAEKDW